MELDDFKLLNEDEQYEVIICSGVVVSSRFDAVHKIILYQLFNFYAEVYHHLEYTTLKWIKGFDNLELLDIYIRDIKIDIE